MTRRFRGIFDRNVIEFLPIQHCFHCMQSQRSFIDPDSADVNVGDLAADQVVMQSNTRHRKVAAPQGKFEESPTPAG